MYIGDGKLQSAEIKFTINDKESGEAFDVNFEVFHNMDQDEINVALYAWLPRSTKFTARDFCGFVNRKNHMTGLFAFATQDELLEALEKYL